MANIIKIPNVNRDERIGSVFNHLFKIIVENNKIKEKEVIWDFSQSSSFLHPFFLFPLAIYKNKCGKDLKCLKLNNYINSYLNQVKFFDFLTISEDKDLENELQYYLNKTYIPICRFDRLNKNIDSMQTIIQKVIEKQRNLNNKLKTPISYFLSELICNINQHSQSQYGYIYSQYLKKEKCLNICIADDGITIYGSYKKANKLLNKINNNEAKAIKYAIEGYSTKNLPEAENRGYGISSTKKMIVDGLGGAFFILSGGAFYRYITPNKDEYVKLPKPIRWDGTVILIRIPLFINKSFNYSEYIE